MARQAVRGTFTGRRLWVAILVVTASLASSAAQIATTVTADRVRAVHAAARPLDAHVDVLMPTTPGIYRTADGVSQLTPRAVMQTLELSRAPVIASHSAVRSMVDETRNLLDEELDGIAARGGVVHVPPFNTYVAPRPPDFVARLGKIRVGFGLPSPFHGVLDDAQRLEGQARNDCTAQALASVPRATIADYLSHIDYAVRRIGIDHVAIGTDFDHGAGIVGFRDASEAPNVTRGLLGRGYSAEDVARIWGGNFMRVLKSAEAAAAR